MPQRKILHIIPSLSPGGSSTQLRLLIHSLSNDQFAAHIAMLGVAGDLQAQEVSVTPLGWRRTFDFKPMLALRRLMHEFQPDVVHAWQPAGLRAALAARGRGRNKLVASSTVPTRPRGEFSDRLDRWLLGQVERVHCWSETEARRVIKCGVRAERVVVIAPGVTVARPATSLRELARLPAGARTIVCVGPLADHKGHRDAIWAFDVLRYLYEDLYLILVGEGDERPRLEHFTGRIRAHDKVRFLGRQPNAAGLLAQADVVWVPSLSAGGVNVALEAMASGRPVVASCLPCLGEVIVEGPTGFLVPPGDKIAFARQTRFLLDDPALSERVGEAGRRHVAARFSVYRLVEDMTRLYHVCMP